MGSTDCVFCKIVAGEIPTPKHYEDADLVAFNDLHPQAPIHVLVVPKKHMVNLGEADAATVGRLQIALPKIATKVGLGMDYQVTLNAGTCIII
jgi:histidine triad (HIT) family protein